MSENARCRLCGAGRLQRLFSVKDLPISHYLRKSLDDPDPRFTVGFESCGDCGLLQIVDVIPADLIYGKADTYTTGFQRPKHLDDLITTTVARQDPGKAIDIGCNDGTLMEALSRAGYGHVVGIEPNPIAAAAARQKGLEVHTSYLTWDLAAELVARHGPFDTVYLRHVVEHVNNLEAFFAAARLLLRDDGLLVIELPEVEEAFKLGSPAVLWEEHVSYFTSAQAEFLLEKHGFRICDRRSYVFGGGSMAFVARKTAAPIVGALRAPSPASAIEVLHKFAIDMERQKAELKSLVSLARSSGFQVLVYGAAPRSCLLVAIGEIAEMIDFVVDDRHDIHHRLMPGTRQFVRPLASVGVGAGSKLLCLLGVGAENEHAVRTRMVAALDAELVFVSLFPPRDTLASISGARRAIAAHQK